MLTSQQNKKVYNYIKTYLQVKLFFLTFVLLSFRVINVYCLYINIFCFLQESTLKEGKDSKIILFQGIHYISYIYLFLIKNYNKL